MFSSAVRPDESPNKRVVRLVDTIPLGHRTHQASGTLTGKDHQLNLRAQVGEENAEAIFLDRAVQVAEHRPSDERR